MAAPSQQLYTFASRDASTIRDSVLRTIKSGLIQRGISNPNVGPNSDYYLFATALGNELAVVQANSVITADQCMPDTAGAAFLDRWLAINGLSRNGPTNSFGQITVSVSASSTLIVTGQQLTDTAGLLYQVTVGGSYGDQDQVPIESISTGSATNHDNGDTLTWVTDPAFGQENVVVGIPGGSDGLEGGADSEDGVDEPPRARLMSRLQNPPKGGNSADVEGWASASTPDVGSCFVYPALLGASNGFFVVLANPQTIGTLSSNSKNRDLPPSLVTGTILPYVLGLMPEHALIVGASAANQPIDVAILLALPSAPTASPPGPGGGWVDGTPWPSALPGGGADPVAPVQVTAVATSAQFTVNAATPPQLGVSHISWISPSDWTIHSATVTFASGTAGAYVITIDTPMTNIAVGSIIFPQSANQDAYLAALFAAFASMGPGEWCDPASSTFKRAFRHPIPSLGAPSAMGATQLKTLINAGQEVLDANYIFRGDCSSAFGKIAAPSPFSSPTIPPLPTVNPTTGYLASQAPFILVPRNLGWYAQ
jgi:Baseplate J-like protein